ncbi:MAG: FAD-dependent monooxygenase [Rhodocyclaceae bacterium]|nr:FAD-dependent monooxygenase [Rhodocyclaceae bacterium]
MTDIQTDILIIGAGPVGMTLALKLMRDEAPWRVLLLDKRERDSHSGDPRALALSHGTRQLLEPLGAWNAAAGTPIHNIHVSQSGGFGRTLITREEQGVPALGYVMRYRDLAGALVRALPETAILDRTEIEHIVDESGSATIHARRDGQAIKIRTQLLVHAEGTPADSGDVFVAGYQQHAVLAEVHPQKSHANRAWERFTPDGPLALLPLGEGYSVVYTVPTKKLNALIAMSDGAFLASLEHQFGRRIGLSSASVRSHYPLCLRIRHPLSQGSKVWIGNAAQTLHPVSGQGFNLGIRDAWELASYLLRDTAQTGRPTLAPDYAASRQRDRLGLATLTDGFVRIFSNDIAPARAARGIALAALDICPSARSFLGNAMMKGFRNATF